MLGNRVIEKMDRLMWMTARWNGVEIFVEAVVVDPGRAVVREVCIQGVSFWNPPIPALGSVDEAISEGMRFAVAKMGQ